LRSRRHDDSILFDVRIASENARWVIFGRVGVMAELGSTYLLPRMIGWRAHPR